MTIKQQQYVLPEKPHDGAEPDGIYTLAEKLAAACTMNLDARRRIVEIIDRVLRQELKPAPVINLNYDAEFVKLIKQYRETLKDVSHSQRSARRAMSLGLMIDAKIETLEKEMARLQQAKDSAQTAMFDVKQVN